ncbi:MAG: ATP-binding protein [Pseudomonadota bacterium]
MQHNNENNSLHGWPEDPVEAQRTVSVLRSMDDGIVVTDREGRVTWLNPAAEKITGTLLAETAGLSLHELLGILEGAGGAAPRDLLRSVVEGGGVLSLDLHRVILPRLNAIIIVAGSAAPLMDLGGAVVGMVVALRDVTAATRAEDTRRRAHRMKSLSDFTHGLAHDLNNILAEAVGSLSFARLHLGSRDAGSLSFARLHMGSRDRVMDSLVHAEKACVRARELSRELDTINSSLHLVKKTESIAALIRETSDLHARGPDLKCEVAVPDGLWHCPCDATRIGQVLSNLIINARQAMQSRGVIRIEAENVSPGPGSTLPLEPGKYVKISVIDTGTGIPEAEIDMVFEPYFTTKERGSGLGLATARANVEKHGGHIEAASSGEEGTRISFYLPAVGDGN